QKLGTHAWRYLHAFAATYPNDPDAKDAERARWQVAALAQLYPCDECRNHLRSHLASPKLGAVETNSRAALSAWICELHNVINFDLGKPQFDC
ncbi:ERV/ALR sulfhydryl oxidase domain-containing protein, partial [Pelagophyceae sp. CCMP2097]